MPINSSAQGTSHRVSARPGPKHGRTKNPLYRIDWLRQTIEARTSLTLENVKPVTPASVFGQPRLTSALSGVEEAVHSSAARSLFPAIAKHFPLRLPTLQSKPHIA